MVASSSIRGSCRSERGEKPASTAIKQVPRYARNDKVNALGMTNALGTTLFGPLHLARCRQRSRLGVDFRVALPAESRIFDVVLRFLRQRRHVQRLQQLMIVGAH